MNWYSIDPDGNVKKIQHFDDDHEQLEAMKKIVEGYIEVVPITLYDYKNINRVIVNEEGLLLNLPINESATDIIQCQQTLRGTVLVQTKLELGSAD